MPSLVLGWGIAQASMAACHNYSDLLAARFFLGLFEAGCLPLFGVITNQWYRRAEQPVRVAAWYGMNGVATIVASALSYGLGHIPSHALYSWQMYVRSFPTADIYTLTCSSDIQNLPVRRSRDHCQCPVFILET
jgi:MFS family permease